MIGDHIYELDGRKDTPINHGTISKILSTEGDAAGLKERFLDAAIKVVKDEFIARDPEELRFTFTALTAAV